MLLIVLMGAVSLLFLSYLSARSGFSSTRFGYFGRGLRRNARRVEPQSSLDSIRSAWRQVLIVGIVLGSPLLLIAALR